MCGIAGFIDPQTAPEVRRQAVERMSAALAHRGPDDSGLETLGEATLGMRRLAIFDPANGHQPMRSPDGRFTLVFNGSIINFRALRNELAAHWEFRTECDTEVLLAAFARWGENCLGRLRGMFALAVWDARDRSLFLARDPFGIKPLYYRHDGSRLLFASEISGLLAAGIGGAEIDPLAAADYLAWFAVPPPRTIYRHIFSLRPGERAIFRQGQIDVRSTWGFSNHSASASACGSRGEFIEELRVRLEETVRAHAVADVPVGAFLSGGLDSAVVAGFMAQASSTRLRTFTIGFRESEYSEADAAAQVARHFGTDHHSHILTGAEVAGDIGAFIAACDQPTGDGLNTFYVSREARKGGVTVALSGLGGDELFGGYPSFSHLPRLAAWLPRWRRVPSPIRRLIIGRLRRGDTRKRKLADFLYHARDIHDLAALQRRVFSEAGQHSLLETHAREAIAGRAPFHPELIGLRADLAAADLLEVASAWELRTYMAEVLLRDTDNMSMRHSLEVRVPFVDRPFIEWLWQQPSAYKYSPDRPKGALAEAAAAILPPELQHRKKQGFALPMAQWMRQELRPFIEDTFSERSIGRTGIFHPGAVQSRWREFLEHDDSREWSRVWSLAVLVAFVNRPTAKPPAPGPRPIVLASAAPTPAVTPPVPAPRAVPAAPVLPTPVVAKFQPPPPAPAPSLPGGHGVPALPRSQPTTAPAVVPRQILLRPEAKKLSRSKPRHCTLLMVSEIFSSVGGIPRVMQVYLKALCDLAAEQGGAVRLLSLNDPEIDSGDLRRYANETLDDWYVCSREKRRFVREAFRMSRGCDRVICGHVAQLPVAWLIRLLRPETRYYGVAHGIEVWRQFRFSERIALRGAARIFCVSEYTRREMLTHLRLAEERTVALPNALDPYFKIEAGVPLAECPPVILVVTRLSFGDRYKGVEDLIPAMKTIRAAVPGAELRIIGQGDDMRRLQSLARRDGLLGEGVEFLGFVDDNRLQDELSRCRLLALPSRSEGFGLVFVEAMARGRPCLGARAGGSPEVIVEDETGILVEFGNVEAIAAGCIDGLRRKWNQTVILERARQLSYPPFKEKLAVLLERKQSGEP